MKQPMSQVLLVTLAIVFATALTVIIAIICLSYLNASAPPEESTKEETEETEEEDEEESSTRHFFTDPSEHTREPEEESTSLRPSAQETEAPTEEETEPPLPSGNGLAFASNGNGTCTLIGIGDCTDVCIVIPERSPAGDKVTSIAPRAFYSCTFATAIQIPSTVTSIGELAFADCDSLVYISVSVKNPYYCDVDGVLYTADLYTLISYPAMHAGSSVSISAATCRISEMAFYNCTYLSHVYYAGTADQWERMEIASKNHSLTAASKTFDSGKK